MTDYEETQARNLWRQVRTAQRDFFLTNQYLSRQLRKARRRVDACRASRLVLTAIPVVTFLIGCLWSAIRSWR